MAINLLYGKIDYDEPDDCKYYLLFCCYDSRIENFKKRLEKLTKIDSKYLALLEVFDSEEVTDQIPDWWINFNSQRYNGEGLYKDYQVYGGVEA